MIPIRRVGDQSSCGDNDHSLCLLTLPADSFFSTLPTANNNRKPLGYKSVIDSSQGQEFINKHRCFY